MWIRKVLIFFLIERWTQPVNLLRESRRGLPDGSRRSSTTPLVSLLCYTSSTLNPWRNVEELVASPSCTKSFMSMWRCHQPTWIWYLQTDRYEELWRNRDWRSFAVGLPRPSFRSPLFPEPSPNATLFLIALPHQLRYLHSELKPAELCHRPVDVHTSLWYRYGAWRLLSRSRSDPE